MDRSWYVAVVQASGQRSVPPVTRLQGSDFFPSHTKCAAVYYSRKGPRPSNDNKVISGKGQRECRYAAFPLSSPVQELPKQRNVSHEDICRAGRGR